METALELYLFAICVCLPSLAFFAVVLLFMKHGTSKERQSGEVSNIPASHDMDGGDSGEYGTGRIPPGWVYRQQYLEQQREKDEERRAREREI